MKTGIFAIGLDTYWQQYEGLESRLTGYYETICHKLEALGTELVRAGMADNVEKAGQAAALFRKEGVSLIFLYVSTYALSHTVLPVVQRAGVPIIVLNLQPSDSIDYERFNSLPDRTAMTGEWLANCQACAVPEIANVFQRSGIAFHQVTGTLNDAPAWQQISEWIEAARVHQVMQNNRMGFLGHFYCGMLDVYSDLTLQATTFGTHIQLIEMDELLELRESVDYETIEQKTAEIHSEFEVHPDCPPEEIRRAAHTAVALDRLAEKHRLGALCYYYDGTPGNAHEHIVTSLIAGNSLLTARHIPVAGEAEVKNVQAMKIIDSFGAGGSFSEFYLMDFEKDELLLGHDGPGHIAIAQGKPILKPLKEYHGKPGKGISVEMKVKNGPVTLLAVAETREGGLKLVVAQGESVPGPILEIGNTNSRYRFSIGVKGFIDAWCAQGPAHHCAVGTGHIASKLEKLGSLLNIPVVQVC